MKLSNKKTIFTPMNTVYSNRETKKYKLMNIEYKPSLKHKFDTEFVDQKTGDIITVLLDLEKDEVVMSDSEMEKRTNLDFLARAKGDVLIGGLGIGMILLAVQDKAEVTSVTVVEIDKDLKDFIMVDLEDKLNDKVSIVISDINEFKTTKKYDTIYFDIWNNIDSDNFDEMKSLKAKFEKNTDNDIIQWRAIDVVEQSEVDGKLDLLTEEDAVELVLRGLQTNSERAKYEYEQSQFNQDIMFEAINDNYFFCESCSSWHDLYQERENEFGERECRNCIEFYND